MRARNFFAIFFKMGFIFTPYRNYISESKNFTGVLQVFFEAARLSSEYAERMGKIGKTGKMKKKEQCIVM